MQKDIQILNKIKLFVYILTSNIVFLLFIIHCISCFICPTDTDLYKMVIIYLYLIALFLHFILVRPDIWNISYKCKRNIIANVCTLDHIFVTIRIVCMNKYKWAFCRQFEVFQRKARSLLPRLSQNGVIALHRTHFLNLPVRKYQPWGRELPPFSGRQAGFCYFLAVSAWS